VLPKLNPFAAGVVVEVFPNMLLVCVAVAPNNPVFCVPGVLVVPKFNPFVVVAGVEPNAFVLGVDPKLNPLVAVVVAPGCDPKPVVEPNIPVVGWVVLVPKPLVVFPKALVVFVAPNAFAVLVEPNVFVLGCPNPGVVVAVFPPNEKPPCCVLVVAGVPPNRLFVVDVLVLPNMPPS